MEFSVEKSSGTLVGWPDAHPAALTPSFSAMGEKIRFKSLWVETKTGRLHTIREFEVKTVISKVKGKAQTSHCLGLD